MDKNKLRGKIVERGKTLKATAAAIGIDVSTLYRKMSGESDFTLAEIIAMAEFLPLSASETHSLFFAD